MFKLNKIISTRTHFLTTPDGDLEEYELKKDVTLRKQRNFILHGDDHSMTSNGTRLSDSDDDSTSEYDYNNESYYSESEREGGGVRQPWEGRTKSAIRKAYGKFFFQ